ncbi:hypothetical protein T265_03139 [Opisthorchis viverrini]|uniref:Peptidase S26 domain-containing protein n=1 Tax=Opisthorchis viverrini TaxID=6198 RepID=A0A075AHS7_OPIVI|nr:hypothetical protein T265_03139 [Opisthorchis viverrini]KER30404.1 hypothetical protein T265_03139 [Opisthorchis viverrini]
MLPKNLSHWLCAFGSSVVLYKYHSYVGTVVYCEGISMEPTVNHGDYLVVERISVLRGRIKKGDVVVAGQPRKSHNCSHVLKRIKALGEEQVTFWDEGHWRMVTREIPADHIWLEGDNSVHSLDSRTYGPVPLSHLEYRVLFRLWPLHQFGRLEPPKAIEASHPSLSRRPADSCADVVCLDAPTE